jgi:hypothetical protein
VLSGGYPRNGDVLKFFCRHSGVCDGENFGERFFSTGKRSLQVAFEQRCEGFSTFPLRVTGRKRLHAVDSKEKLEVKRLLSPQSAVVIEGRDAFSRFYEVWATRSSDTFNKGNDGFSGGPLIP